MENDSPIQTEGFIDSWMSLAAVAKKEVLARSDLKSMEQRIDACEKAAVGLSLNNLMTYPWVRERVEEGRLNLIGCYYDLRNGELITLDEIG
jgi:carbonic anhydrase